ncbi:facilitated trehalose transporter Tret1-like [Spodoptera litura]|uniref:Facilitated trehalose transporter Tret1-like n=1 Tax=Spodoptera litura TaxID=69820 RepID=A0A9J7EMP2_SPOLT|nr:facilitated trehalose transporter Tret1-like [Spodoptera litura]
MSNKTNRKVQYLAGVCAAFSFTFTGATLAWSSPAIPKFKSGEANVVITDTQTSWVVSLHSAGALLGCYFGQVLNERAGRRRTFLGSAVPGLLGATLLLNTTMPELMYVARFMMGLATGIIAVVTMIYVTEISDKEIRGALGMTVQVMNNLGSLTVYSVGPFVSYKTLNCIILIIPVCYVLLCLWIPESPYYHLKDGRIEAAKKEFMRLKGNQEESLLEEQMNVMRAHVRESMENKTTLRELLTNMRYRKAVYIVTGLKLLQYMTGILVIQSYLEPIFRQSNFVSGPIASIVYGFVQLGAGIGATFLSRWFGRRILLSISCLGVSIAMTLVGLYFFLQDTIQVSVETSRAISWMPLVGILGFNVLYAVGVGNLPYVLQAELFPVNVKGVASSTATMLACILSFLVTKCYQQMKDACGHYMVFWSFAFIGYVGVLFIYFFVPETKGKTLEEVTTNIQDQRPEEQALNTEKIEKA